MRLRLNVLAAIALLGAPATAAADPPTRITIVAAFDPLTYGENAYVNGQLFGTAQAGQLVGLEQSAPPFTDWAPVAQATADAAGYYSFKLRPSQTMQYRTGSHGVPSERVVQVSVAPRIAFKAAAAGNSSIRFSGTFAPALDGQSVAIQRRTTSGWKTVASVRLHSGKTFEGRVRAHRATQLRAFFTTDGAHLGAHSKTVPADPSAHAAGARAAATCRAPTITNITTRPDPPRAGNAMTLRVAAAMPAGKLSAIDILWGEAAKRDYFTLAPAFRKQTVTFALRHRYARPGTYNLRIRVEGRSGTCKRTRTIFKRLEVARAPERAQP
jgi:hypothetical protein